MNHPQNPYYQNQPPPRSGGSINAGLIAILILVGGGAVAVQHFDGRPAANTQPAQSQSAPQPQGAPNPDAFKVFNQCDPAWGSLPYANASMCKNGCGPTAAAMAITGLTGKLVTPKETREFMQQRRLYQGGASVWTFPEVVAPQWGLRAVKIPGTEQAIKDVINKRGFVILSGHGQLPFVPDKTPGAGHYLVIRALDPDGKIRVGNSAFSATNKQSFTLSSLIDNIHKGSEYALFAA